MTAGNSGASRAGLVPPLLLRAERAGGAVGSELLEEVGELPGVTDVVLSDGLSSGCK